LNVEDWLKRSRVINMINKKDAWNFVPSILFSTAGSMTTAIFIYKMNYGGEEKRREVKGRIGAH